MGVHAFSGSLIRLYTNDGENEIQRFARENGIGYNVSYAGEPPVWPSREEVVEHVAWMRSSLQDVGLATPSWNDDGDEYHTIKIHQEGRDAISLVAAHLHRPDLAMPRNMPNHPMDDAAYAEAGKKGYLIGPIAAFDASLILPGTFDGVRLIESPIREEVLVCSTDFLRKALEFVANGYWLGRVLPDEWCERGLAYARGSGSTDVGGVFSSD